MKKNLYSVLVLILASSQMFAQCGQRYKDKIFTNVTKTSNITYTTSNSITLRLDVYEPAGDTATNRPLIIMAHGGSFYGGDKASDGTCVAFCNNFAKRGYVTASINYRLGDAVQMFLDSSYAIRTVLNALSDGKSAIRYFRKNADSVNTWRINPNIIFIGGNSAGAVLYMHSIYVDSVGELPPALQTIINQNGGFEGNSGNFGYSSEAQALINLAGGLNVPEFVGPNSKPSVNFQGTSDNTVPYNCAYPINGSVNVRLCGLGAIEPLYQQYGTHHETLLFPGDGHCPWDGSAPKLAQVDTVTANFLYDLMCSGMVSVNDIEADMNVTVYPNPASDEITVSSSEPNTFSKVELLDETGRLLKEKAMNTSVSFDCTGFARGLYFVRIIKTDSSAITKKIMLN